MAQGMTGGEYTDWNIDQDNKAARYLNLFSSGDLARMAIISACDADENSEGEDSHAILLEAGAFANLAILRKMIEDGKIDPVRELPPLPE